MPIANLCLSTSSEVEFNVRQCGRIPSSVFQSSNITSSVARRAFNRQPGRPQTAAFAPVCSTELQRRPVPLNNASLKDCIEMRRLSIETRLHSCSTPGNNQFSSVSSASENSRKTFTRCKSSITHREIELCQRKGVYKNGFRSPLPIKCNLVPKDICSSKKKISFKGMEVKSMLVQSVFEANSFPMTQTAMSASTKVSIPDVPLVDRIPTDMSRGLAFDKTSVDEMFFETMAKVQIGQLPNIDTTQSKHCSHLEVYHFVGDRLQNHGRNGTELKCANDEQLLYGEEITKYEVEIEDPVGCHSTAGLGRSGSPENIALRHLLQKQLAMNERDQRASDEMLFECDRSVTKDVDSLNVLVSQFINTRLPPEQLYYFAYAQDTNTEWFSTHFTQKPEYLSWALLYGFRLQSGQHLSGRVEETWPLVEFWPQSAVQGRVYLITREWATVLDNYVLTKLGLETVMLPVWLMEMSELNGECAAVEYCVAALVCVHPTKCL